jgi:nicotinamidase/pyrazinamidase
MERAMALRLTTGTALLVIDVQNDFLPGGALAVRGGNAILPVLNRYLAAANSSGTPVYASRDWHPVNHCSFTPQNGAWPPHCVADTQGAAFAPALELPSRTVIVDKGTHPDLEAYSAFAGTGLAERLRAAGISNVLVGGLAADYCVLNTVTEALAEGFGVIVLCDGIAAVNVNPDDGARAETTMRELDARFATLADIDDESAHEPAAH